jgi:glyoxylase-like metal-dependent hydrolase (beta-lactamase superfamily II)
MSRGVATNRDSLARRVTMSPVQIADGIFKVDGLRIANVYLVATEEGLLLVDTGCPGTPSASCPSSPASGASRATFATSSLRTATSITSVASPS